MPSFMKKTKPKPGPEATSTKAASTKPSSATPQQGAIGNAAVQETMAAELSQQEALEQSLMGSGLLAEPKAAKASKPGKARKPGPTPEEAAQRDAAVQKALIDAGLMAGPKKEKAPKDPDAPAKKSMGSRIASSAGKKARGVGSAASGAASAVGSGLSGAAEAVVGAGKSVKKGLGFGPKAPMGPVELTPEQQRAANIAAALEKKKTYAALAKEKNAEVQTEGAGAIADFTAKNGNHTEGDAELDDYCINDNVAQAMMLVDDATTSEDVALDKRAANRRLGMPDPEPDPFMYHTPALNKTEIDAFLRLGLTKDEIVAVTLYSGPAAYEMNKVLRGMRADDSAIRAYLPWVNKLDSALSKMPKEVRNAQKGVTLDGSKAPGEKLSLTTAFRNDTMQNEPRFEGLVKNDWRVGGRVAEPGFMSATAARGAYGGAMEVTRVIDMNGQNAAASVIDLSQKKHENEVLFRPGTAMQFTAMTDNDTGESVKNPDAHAQAKGKEVKDLSLTADVKIVGAPTEEEKAGGGEGDKEAEESAEKADIATAASVLARSTQHI